MLEKSKPLYNVEMITVFQRRNNVSLSILNQRQNLKLKQRWFWVDHKNIFALSYVLLKFRWANNWSHFNAHFGFNVVFFDVFLKEKKLWSLCPLLMFFRYFNNESRLAVFFRCNLISMYFFKVISFHFEISYVIIRCLGTITLVNICYDLICSQSQWFSANILWKFAGNSQSSHPFSVSCRFLKASMRFFPFNNFKSRL